MQQLHVELRDSGIHVAAFLAQQFDFVDQTSIYLNQLLQRLNLLSLLLQLSIEQLQLLLIDPIPQQCLGLLGIHTDGPIAFLLRDDECIGAFVCLWNTVVEDGAFLPLWLIDELPHWNLLTAPDFVSVPLERRSREQQEQQQHYHREYHRTHCTLP